MATTGAHCAQQKQESSTTEEVKQTINRFITRHTTYCAVALHYTVPMPSSTRLVNKQLFLQAFHTTVFIAYGDVTPYFTDFRLSREYIESQVPFIHFDDFINFRSTISMIGGSYLETNIPFVKSTQIRLLSYKKATSLVFSKALTILTWIEKQKSLGLVLDKEAQTFFEFVNLQTRLMIDLAVKLLPYTSVAINAKDRRDCRSTKFYDLMQSTNTQFQNQYKKHIYPLLED